MASLAIASTPLVVLIAAARAFAARRLDPASSNALVLIEDFADAARWRDVLVARGAPFDRVDVVPGRASELQQRGRIRRERAKRVARNTSFATLARIDRELAPDVVLVGNDRRPETQYALHLAAQRRPPRAAQPGVYLDDGLFTYVGDVHARPIARVVDGVLKRWRYGPWWQSVRTVGTSRWIAEAVLAFPDEAALGAATERHALLPAQFASLAFRRLVRDLCDAFGLVREPAANRYQALVLLPHSGHWREPASQRSLVGDLVRRARGRIAVKYHPREQDADPLDLANIGAHLLPRGLAAELLAPRLARRAEIHGTTSTALLAARWLRPDCKVYDVGTATDDFSRRAARFLASHGVQRYTGTDSFEAIA